MIPVSSAMMRDMDRNVAGAGTATIVSDDRIDLSATAGPDNAFIFKNFFARAGEKVVLVFKAKVNSGSGLGASITYPNDTTEVTATTITSGNWEEYRIEYVVPHTTVLANYIRFRIGFYNAFRGTASVSAVRMYVENSMLPVGRVYGAALLSINAGNATINNSFACIGFDKNLSISGITTSINLTIQHTDSGSASQSAPIILCSTTRDFPTAEVKQMMCKPGNYNRSTGAFTVSFVNSVTGGDVDVSAVGQWFMWVLAIGV